MENENPEDLVKDDSFLQFNPSCIRKKSNWSKSAKEYKFDSEDFNPEQFLKDIQERSPKLHTLLSKIEKLDAADHDRDGHYYKHFIFCDLKSGNYGAKMLAAAFIAKDMTMGYTASKNKGSENGKNGKPLKPLKKKLYGKIAFVEKNKLTKERSFFLLSSVSVFDQPISVANKKQILATFNKRPDNIHGEDVRFIIMDSGFKEGIDLFDIKYVHIFEPSVNSADQKQVIGRGTRTCGQKGLIFHPTQGWPLHVFIYDLSIPEELQHSFLAAKSTHDLYLKSLNIDLRMFEFNADLEKTVIFGSVDHELTENIHSFVTELVGGGQHYPQGTQKNYNSFSSRDLMMEKGKELEFSRRAGGGKGEPGVPPSGGPKKKRLVIDRTLPPLIINTKTDKPVLAYMNGQDMVELGGDRQPMTFQEMRQYIRKYFSDTAWGPAKMENLCEEANATEKVNATVKTGGVGGQLITYSPTQEFVRRYFTPQAPVKGMLLWHSVGTGKTCSAVAAATSSFEPQGYTILWVTRTTLKNDIWKNMFDQVCSEVIKRRIQNEGLVIPDDSSKRMKLLSKSWKIRPMSYKQFSNLVSKDNNFYKTLVSINGKEDPLRKTLLIIDEAHKLYGGGDAVLSSAERPNMAALHSSLMNSYTVSGQDSVRLLLMTATPITDNPIELIKLINLCKPSAMQLPDEFPTFSESFLNMEGHFSEQGRKIFLDEIAGYVSYLNREKDARQFSQPRIQYIMTPVVQNVGDLLSVDRKFARGYYDKDVLLLKNRVLEENGKIDADLKDLHASRFHELTDRCDEFEGPMRKNCTKVAKSTIRELVKEARDHTKKIRETIKNIRKEIRDKNIFKRDELNKLGKTDPAELDAFKASSFYQLKYKCGKKVKPDTKLKEASANDPKIVELSLDLEAYDSRIKQMEDGLRSELDTHNARIKRIKNMLRTGDLNDLERSVLKLTMADARKTHKVSMKLKKKTTDEVLKDLNKTKKRLEKDKKKRYVSIRKSLKKSIRDSKKEKREALKVERDLRKTMKKQEKVHEEIKSDVLKDLVNKYSFVLEEKLNGVEEELEEKAEAKMALKKAKEDAKEVLKLEKDKAKALEKAEKLKKKEEEKTRKIREKQELKDKKDKEKTEKKLANKTRKERG